MRRIYIIPDKERMEESLALAREYDCSFEYNDFYLPEVLDNPEKTDELIAFYKSQQHDITKDTIHGAFLDITIHSQDPLIRDASMLRIRQSMEVAGKLGVRGVVFHTGRLAGFRVDYYLEHWLRENVNFFTQMLEEFPEQEIYMENMFDEAPDILAGMAQAMAEESRFGICLDYAHAALTTYSGEDWVESLAPYIRHMHINDNDLVNDLHQSMGDGEINWELFERMMWQYKVDASVLIEVRQIESQRKSLEYMKRCRIYPFDTAGGETECN